MINNIYYDVNICLSDPECNPSSNTQMLDAFRTLLPKLLKANLIELTDGHELTELYAKKACNKTIKAMSVFGDHDIPLKLLASEAKSLKILLQNLIEADIGEFFSDDYPEAIEAKKACQRAIDAIDEVMPIE